MAIKFSNNAVTTLSAGISAGVTSFQVASSSGFPTLGGSDWTYVTVDSEVVKITAISGTTFTCVATSSSHSNGDNVELRMTAELLDDFATDTESLPLAGGTMTGNIVSGDNVKATYGAGADLQIYHNGSHSYIDDVGTGDLNIGASSAVKLRAPTGGELYATFNDNGAVNLYYDAALKLATTSTGIDVTGTVTSSATSGYTRLQDLNTAVVSGTDMGGVEWRTGDSSVSGANRITAKISAVGDGTFNATDKAPTKLVFATHGSSGVNPVDRLTINSTGIDVTGTVVADGLTVDGNVGIGTSSPPSMLTVTESGSTFAASADTVALFQNNGTTGTGAKVSILSGNAATGDLNFADENDENVGLVRYSHSDNSMQFRTNNAERMRIDSSGNVGIGTSSPSKTLDINGTARVNSDFTITQGTFIHSEAANVDTYQVSNTNASFSGDVIDISTTRAGTASAQFLRGTANGVSKFALNTNGSMYQTGTATNYFNPNGDSYIMGGNVGIGTSSPSYKLTLFENANNFLQIQQTGDSVVGSLIGRSSSKNLRIQNSENAATEFWTNNAERMRIDSSGNVGIGTTSPTSGYKLDVNGKIIISQGDAEIRFNSGGGWIGNSAEANTVVIGTSGSERLRIDSSGNVGIGTSVAPAQKLTVTGVSGASVGGLTNGILALTTGTGVIADTRLLFGIVDDNYAWLQAADYGVAYRDIAINPNGGNVGIGTSSPDGKLQVVGKGVFGDDNVAVDKQLNAISDGGSTQQLGLYDTRADSSTRYSAVFHRVGTNGSMTWVGSISNHSGGVSFNTSSDYRLKENVDYDWDATTRLKGLKPCRFNWISDPDNTLQDGFLAHEVSDYVPEAILEEKDAEIMQSIDQSKLVPLLVKTIQELEARITALEA